MIVITWMGLTQYGARCIGEFVKRTNDVVKIVQLPASRFSQGNLAELTGCEIINATSDDSRDLVEIVGDMPSVMVLAGWAAPAFVRWAKSVKKAGGKVILGTDEAFTDKSIKQRLRKWRFLLQFNPWIDKVFVCGEGGRIQFVDFYGLPSAKVFKGCYASDPTLFFNGPPLRERAKRFIYVGRFDDNKNILAICEAFRRVHERHGDWEFEICGSGPLVGEIGRFANAEEWSGKTPAVGNGFVLTGFVDNAMLGGKYRGARCFILGSHKEKWGVVVHEAASSGCMLLLSQAVGSHYDFARKENSALFDSRSVDQIETGMEKIVTMTDSQLDMAQKTSVELAALFSPAVYADNLTANIQELGIRIPVRQNG